MQQQQEEQSMGFESSISLAVFLCQSIAATVEVVLHRRFGSRYLGLQAFVGMFMAALWVVFWPNEDLRPMMYFFGLYLLFCLFARIGVARRGLRGETNHSRYSGQPHLLRVYPRLSEVAIKRGVEPVVVFVCGSLLMPVNQPLGSYLITAAVGLFISVNLTLHYQDVLIKDMRDAHLEQRDRMERYHQLKEDQVNHR